jgi:HlyD family secretion protein
MTANVIVDVATVKDVLRVPNAALRFKPPATPDDGEKNAAQKGGDPSARMARGAQGGGGLAGAARQMPGGRRPGGGARPQTVYTLGADKKLTPVEIRTGISDGRYTHVVSGPLQAGAEIVVGMATTKVEGPPPMGGAGGPGGGPRGGRR